MQTNREKLRLIQRQGLTYTHRERKTNKIIDRKAVTKGYKQTDQQTDRETERERMTQKHRATDRQ